MVFHTVILQLYTCSRVFSISFIASNYLFDYSLFKETASEEKLKIAFAK